MVFILDNCKNIFTIPWVNHPITWYGVLFALGFCVSYFLLRYVLSQHVQLQGLDVKDARAQATMVADRLCGAIVIGTLIGARCAHMFFYEPVTMWQQPWVIFEIWQGGLASHGAVVGIVIAALIFCRSNRAIYSWLRGWVLLDALAIVAGIAGAFIRVGNFINQEVLGTPTSWPWGVIFLHPMQRAPFVPLHPVQLYEAFFYTLVALFLFAEFRRRKILGEGRLLALFFILIFGFRFFIEMIKLPQSEAFVEQHITMGQILSLPCFFFGIALLIYQRWQRHKNEKVSS